jgi:hypothetical protein
MNKLSLEKQAQIIAALVDGGRRDRLLPPANQM